VRISDEDLVAEVSSAIVSALMDQGATFSIRREDMLMVGKAAVMRYRALTRPALRVVEGDHVE
jgi:hypothetical protein